MDINKSWLDTIGTVISLLTISSCLFLKVPQIKKIYSTQSSEGIYAQAIVLEITSYTIMMLYNYVNGYAILTYLEYPIILIQVYLMLYLVMKYSNQQQMLLIPAISYFSIVFLFAQELLPVDILCYLVPCCTPFSAFAKIGYVYGIIQAGNADAVSLATWIISVATNLARVFTVYLDSGDKTLIFNFLFSMCLSSLVLLTSIYYKYNTNVSTYLGVKAMQTCRKSGSHLD